MERLEIVVRELGARAGKSEAETEQLLRALAEDEEARREFVYYLENQNFLGEYKVAGYSVVDLLVWQMDHFRAHMDRPSGSNRYQHYSLIFDTFLTFYKMKQNPREYVDKISRESGTDFVERY